MASKRPFPEEDFTCPVCCDVFKDPVLLSCSHSTCSECIRRYWQVERTQKCPVCRKRSIGKPPLNLALKNLCKTFLEIREDPEVLCEIHNEKLKLFCSDDGQLACVVCRDSNKHLNHKFSPVDEAAVELKDIIKSALKPVAVKMKTLQDAQINIHRKVDHVKKQTQYVKDQIKKEFKKLHQFLQKEQAALLTELTEEQQLKTQMLQNKVGEMNKEILSLSNTIRTVAQELQSEDIKFVKSFEKTLEKAQCTLCLDPDEISGELIDVANYLGNLQFRVWKNMQNIIKYSPIILDPNTAHKQLVLSADLTSVRDSNDDDEDDDRDDETSTWRRQPLDTPERFDCCLCVLGSEGFYSGTHSWDVDVGSSSFWMLGVTTESGQRKERNIFPSGAWGIGYDDKCLCARSPMEPCLTLPEAAKPRVVRVRLDMTAGYLWFSDPTLHVDIYKFSHRFTEMVYPFFHSLCNLSPLKVLPLEPVVELNRPS
ncbi:zinc-binding protein A33-like [Brachyhypopomus gauderio]|uniref:zinc-binding protein A33-like n=1 Tax=Brachyhypopomus gauderio TaxID=698409 RepID=UPI0040422389